MQQNTLLIHTENSTTKIALQISMVMIILSSLTISDGITNELQELLNIVLWVIIEEISFRLLLFKKYLLNESTLSIKKSIILSAIVFSSMHLFNEYNIAQTILQTAYAYCFGIYASTILYETNSLLTIINLHVFLNVIHFPNEYICIILAAIMLLSTKIIWDNKKYNK